MNSLCVIKEKAWEELCSFSWFLCLIVPLLSSVSRLVGWKSCLPDDDGNVGTMLSEPPKESENSVHRQQCEIITGKIILSSNNFFNVSKKSTCQLLENLLIISLLNYFLYKCDQNKRYQLLQTIPYSIQCTVWKSLKNVLFLSNPKKLKTIVEKFTFRV